jgi:CHAD domain-containing protein
LKKARRKFRRADPEAVHDLRVALRRAAATAAALGRSGLARDAKKLVRSLSKRRELEIDRHLLSRLGELGFLSAPVAAGLGARWDNRLAAGRGAAERIAEGSELRRLEKRLARLDRKAADGIPGRLRAARAGAERALASPPDGADDRALHRYRLRVKRARYLAEDLLALGVTGSAECLKAEKELQETIGRWNDVRLFRERLARERRKAEHLGSITVAAELDHVLSTLEFTVAESHRAAVQACRSMSNVVPLSARSA